VFGNLTVDDIIVTIKSMSVAFTNWAWEPARVGERFILQFPSTNWLDFTC